MHANCPRGKTKKSTILGSAASKKVLPNECAGWFPTPSIRSQHIVRPIVMTKNTTAKQLGEKRVAKPSSPPKKRKVERYSPHRLLRQPLILAGEITVSAEKHKGRIVVRVESPDRE